MKNATATETYQIHASEIGWVNATPVLIEDISFLQAATIGFGYALITGQKVRIAAVSDCDNLEQRNACNEVLGAGVFLEPTEAKRYIRFGGAITTKLPK